MELHQKLREALGDCTFGPPATEGQIRRVERELGVTLPEDIRRLYLHYDGFDGGEEAPEFQWLPLIGPEPRKLWGESLLGWNLFRKGRSWEPGCELPAHVLELGFLNADEYFGIDLRTGEVMVVFRRGNEIASAGQGLCELLAEEYEDQRRFRQELDDRVFKGRAEYYPVKADQGTQRDIDRLILGYVEARPAAFFLKQLADDPARPGGTWVLSVGFDPGWEEVRITSPTGDCPLIIESDISGTTTTAVTVEQAIAVIIGEVEKHGQRSRRDV